jgi:hypothetical protein
LCVHHTCRQTPCSWIVWPPLVQVRQSTRLAANHSCLPGMNGPFMVEESHWRQLAKDDSIRVCVCASGLEKQIYTLYPSRPTSAPCIRPLFAHCLAVRDGADAWCINNDWAARDAKSRAAGRFDNRFSLPHNCGKGRWYCYAKV